MHFEHQDAIFLQTKKLQVFDNKIHALPFLTHPIIPLIIDVLARKELHHLFISGNLSPKLQEALIESIAHLLHESRSQDGLGGADVIALNLDFTHLTKENLLAFSEQVQFAKKNIILVLNRFPNQDLWELIKQTILMNPLLRLIIIDKPESVILDHCLARIDWSTPNKATLIALLQTYQAEIETYHRIKMPEDIFNFAYQLTSQYLNALSPFDSCLTLIDSTAARAASIGQDVTPDLMQQVIADWTQIPLARIGQFKLNEFTQTLHRVILGQETAINLIAANLQTAMLNPIYQHHASSLKRFLFVGPTSVGKKQLAKSLATYLFGNETAFFTIYLPEHSASWHTLQTDRHICLKDMIAKKPYAIIFFENVQQLNPYQLTIIKQILLVPEFANAIIIFSTVLISPSIESGEKNSAEAVMDLMQLVLNDTNPTPNQAVTELQNNIIPILQSIFTADILRYLHIIPCEALDKIILEKILKIKLQQLSQNLLDQFCVELQCAPEVVQFLLRHILKSKTNAQLIDQSIEQILMPCVAHTLLTLPAPSATRYLCISLNAAGQILKSEWATKRHLPQENFMQ